MRLIAIKALERSIGGPRWQLTIKQDAVTSFVCDAIQLYTFGNGWTLFLLENFSIDSTNMILANRDGEVSLAPSTKPPFTLKPQARAAPKVEAHAPNCNALAFPGEKCNCPYRLDQPCPVFGDRKFRECWFCWEEVVHPVDSPPPPRWEAPC